MTLLDTLRADLAELTDREPSFFRAPGRVNLIGEHVDYSGGFVLPLAIDSDTIVAAAPRDDRRVRIRSREFGEIAGFDLDEVLPQPDRTWSDYARGVTLALRRRVPLVGADLAVGTALPIGAGLASSAAFEIAVGLALTSLAGRSVAPRKLAQVAQEAENGFVGLRSGIMDQLACVFGVRDHALLIDCRKEAVTPVRIPAGAAIAIADTGVKHELARSAYNARRAECDDAARHLGVTALRDVSSAVFAREESRLPAVLRKRVRHVVGENARVLAAVDALRRGDLDTTGALMNASHASLRDDYEVSVPELDLLAAVAQRVDGVYGARMTGGGFGGSIVVLLREANVPNLARALDAAFEQRYKRSAPLTVVRASAGAGPLSPPPSP
jgi:galactokinase